MRVLIFSTAYLPHIGGAEVAVKEITDRLLDISFVMVTAKLDPALSDYEKIGNVEVYRVGRGSGFDKFRLFFAGVKKAGELGKFDLVWSIMASYAGFSALRYKNKNSKIPYLLTLQEGDSRFHIYKHVWFVWPYFKQIFKKADKIQAISNYLAEWAKSLGAESESTVIPNAIDPKVFKRVEDVGSLKLELGVVDKKVVITTSRLVKKNGVGNLIDAFVFLEKDTHLLIVGEGELRAEFEKKVDDNNLSNRVHFVGQVDQKLLPKYLSVADIFCRPSLSEGLGISFLEAMSVGLPVVCTKVGGIPDFLEDGQTGWFCEVNNPKSIAEKIKFVLDSKNSEMVGFVVQNAHSMIKTKFEWESVAKAMGELFFSMKK